MRLLPNFLVRESKRYRFFAYVCLGVGLFIIVGGIFFPLYRTPQTFAVSGPSKPFTQTRSYWIDFYILPEIAAGNTLNMAINSSGRGTVYAYVFTLSDLYHRGNTQAGGPIAYVVMNQTYTHSYLRVPADITDSYVVEVIAFTENYHLIASSVWAPFYWFRDYFLFGFVLVILSLPLYYYGRLRLAWERQVFGQVRSKKTKSLGLDHGSTIVKFGQRRFDLVHVL